MKNSRLMGRIFSFLLSAILSLGSFDVVIAEEANTTEDIVYDLTSAGLMVEAEDLTLQNFNVLYEDSEASGGYATIGTSESVAPEVTGTPPAFSVKMNVKETGDYLVYFRLKLTKGGSGTCRMGIDGGRTHYNIYGSTEYQWVAMATYKLLPGYHTLDYFWRNSRVIIDKIIITSNACDAPVGMGELPGKFSLDNVKTDYANLLYPLPPVVPKKEHPRLFATKDKIPEIKKNLTHEQNIQVYNNLLEMASKDYDCKLDQNNVSNNTNTNYLEYIEANAFLYLINGDRAAGDKAVKGIHSYLSTLNVAQGDIASRDGAMAIFVAAYVYDWCHDIIPQNIKEEIINLAFLNAGRGEFRWPSVQMSAYNSDHGDEYGLMKNLFAFSIAIYDDYENPYNIVAGRLFAEYVPSRNAKYEKNIYNTQGDDYGMSVRGGADFFFRLMLDQLGCADMLSQNQHEGAYTTIFRRLPNGWHPQDSDIYSFPTGAYGVNVGTLFIAANMFKDPYLKGELFLADSGKGVASMNDRTISNALYLCLNDTSVGTMPKEQLPLSIYTGDNSGIMMARTSWDMGFDSNALVVSMKMPEKHYLGHSHRDAGHFYVYFKGPLAIDSGIYQSEPFVDQAGNVVTSLGVSSLHNRNYAQQTIGHNSMLIYDPEQKVVLNNGQEIANTGGQTEPVTNAANLEQLTGDHLKMGEVIAKDMGDDMNKPDFTYLSGDITGAYGYRAKEYTRSFMFFNFFDEVYPGALVVFDRVTASDPNFKKTWLLHSQNEPVVEDNRTTVRYDEFEYNGRLINDTLLPKQDNAKITKIGGPGKEYLIGDWNYMAIPTQTTRDESGKWRVEISPKAASEKDYFLNVIQVGESSSDPQPLETELIDTEKFYGAKIKDRVAFFSKENKRQSGSFVLNVPGKENESLKIAVADLSEGVWTVHKDGKLIAKEYVTSGGTVLYFDGECGDYEVAKTREYVKSYEKDISILSRLDTTVQERMIFSHNGNIRTSVLPVKFEDEIYLPISKIVPLFDDLATIEHSDSTMTISLYDEPQDRKVTLTVGSKSSKLLLSGEASDVTLNFPIREKDGEMYIHYTDLKQCFDVDSSYGPLGKRVFVTSKFSRVDNSQYIVNIDDGKRVRVKNLMAKSFEDSLPPYKAVDNNLASWFTCDGKEEWLVIELEEEYDIKDLAVIFGNRYLRQEKFAVEVSSDGENYREVFSGMSEVMEKGDSTTFEIFDVKAEGVKFVRLRLLGNTVNNKNTIYELYITKQ